MNNQAQTNQFQEQLQSCRKSVEASFHDYLPSELEEPHRLHQAINYSLSAGGKRIRPVLLMAVANSLSSRLDCLPACVAVECLHTYSLIHDDLPAMDNSDLRRGKPTCHCQFDEATAILAGDALLTLAFDLLAREYSHSPTTGLQLVQELAVASGSTQLVGGQMMDLENTGRQPTVKQLENINRRKTGALFAASTAMGAIVAEADKEICAHFRHFGATLGAAFQVVDDILDSTQNQEVLGKTAGLDQTNEKITFVSLEGLEAARNRAHKLTNDAHSLLDNLPGDQFFLNHLIEHLLERTH